MKRDLFILGATALISGLFCTAGRAEERIDGITEKMTVVIDDLDRSDTGKPVQTKQKEVLDDLDKLIADLEKQCQACRAGVKRNNPNRGMRDSMISRGTGGSGPLSDPGESQKDWAKLSARERDRILQSMSEGFPPEYRTILERYYRRLADEKAAPTDAPKPEKPSK